MEIAGIREDFAFLGSWEERYEYIIDLGRDLEEFPEGEKNEKNRIKGCMSQVWLLASWDGSGQERRLHLKAASDSSIVRGLAALLLVLYNGVSEAQLADVSAREIFDELGLSEHLSPSRRNGLAALEQRVRDFIARGP